MHGTAGGATPDPVIPAHALVLLVGPAGSGKSTWARQRFHAGAVLSSDELRAWVSGDAADQAATADAFRVLHAVAAARLRRGLLTVVDATNLSPSARKPLLELASRRRRPRVAIVFDAGLDRSLAWNAARPGRRVPEAVVRRHHAQLQAALRDLPEEGFTAIHVLRG